MEIEEENLIHRFVYSSSAVQQLNDDELRKLSVLADLRNRQLDITGLLFYSGKSFIQYLEGPRDSLLNLIQSLEADDRHQIEHRSWLTPRDHRIFPGWGMRMLDPDKEIAIIPDFIAFVIDSIGSASPCSISAEEIIISNLTLLANSTDARK